MEQAPPIITLTTDFGLTDPYVGQLKGVLLKGCPSATLVDITHAVPAWNVLSAALTLHTTYPHFPARTVHLIVVDPGVGSSRSILAAYGDGHFFVCPDNGILSFLLEEEKIQTVCRVEYGLDGKAVSPTFHGRDIMAPVAASLARGEPVETFGPILACSQVKMLQTPIQQAECGRVHGQVLAVDHFGNVRTSIRCKGGDALHSFLYLTIRGYHITRFVTSYSEASPGEPIVLLDSSGFVEIAANQENVAALLDCRPGDQLSIELGPKQR